MHKKVNGTMNLQEIIYKLDTIANSIEKKGLIKESYMIDIISNTLEKEASFFNYLLLLIDYMKSGKRTFKDIYDKYLKGIQLWPFKKNVNVDIAIKNLWKKALLKAANKPENIKNLIRSFNLAISEIEKLIMPIEDLAGFLNTTKDKLISYLNEE